MDSSYRPHNSGHDYSDKGIYLITLVVRNRAPLLGKLNMEISQPGVELTELGKFVEQQWAKMPALQNKHGNHVNLLKQTVMPDHWHAVIEICSKMDTWTLGDIMQATKCACTSELRRQNGLERQAASPILAKQLTHMTPTDRSSLYATFPREEQPLFDDNYDDTICLDEIHLSNMIRYVEDNPRRAIIRKLRPDFMRRCLHIKIGERDYAAFGNLFLLRWPRKIQVYCHRYARLGELITNIPYTNTEDFIKERNNWMNQIMEGGTVLVTPGISQGEEIIKHECLEKGYPLIHIQKDPIGPYWKPEGKRFTAAENGNLLILAPWPSEQSGETDYAIFHSLNTLAAEICNFKGEAKVLQ